MLLLFSVSCEENMSSQTKMQTGCPGYYDDHLKIFVDIVYQPNNEDNNKENHNVLIM